MIRIRRSEERGHARHGWLDSHHTFSFADYYDPAHMGFRSLRVINDDRVSPGRGFGGHGHRSMEIVSYVVEGGLEHKDSMGHGSVIRPGEVQLMSAGTGVMHSEFNSSKTDGLRFLQIWILPRAQGGPPRYLQREFPPEERSGKLRLLVSPNGKDDSLVIQQDASIYGSLLDSGQSVAHPLAAGRHAWVQVVRGSVEVNGLRLSEGDGAAISEEETVLLTGLDAAELLLFDLA